MKIEKKIKKLYAYIPKNIYNELEIAISSKELEMNKLDWRMLVLFMYNAVKMRYKDKNYPDGRQVFPLNAQVLKDIDSKYKKYIDFLVLKDFLNIKKEGSPKNGTSRMYEISKRFYETSSNMKIEEIEFEYGDSIQITNNINSHTRRSVEAEYLNPELTKWLSDEGDRFSFDENGAMDYINKEFLHDKHKRQKREITIKQAVKKTFRYTRDGKDNRLHTLFTNMAKDLKRFFTFDKKRIKGKDIKSSHPVLFTWLLEVVLKEILKKIAEKNDVAPVYTYDIDNYLREDYINSIKKYYVNNMNEINVGITKGIKKELKKIREYDEDVKEIVYNIITMLQNSFVSIDFTEIYRFIKQVRRGTFYEEFADDLLRNGVIKYDVNTGKYLIVQYCKKKNYLKEHEHKTPRDAAKAVSMNILYSVSNNKALPAVKFFRNKYKSVELFLNAFRSNAISSKEEGHKNFAILVQNFEASLVLDHCSKKIAKKYPEMLLISIHDSLNTSEENFEILEKEFQQLLNEKLGFHVVLGTEEWFDSAA